MLLIILATVLIAALVLGGGGYWLVADRRKRRTEAARLRWRAKLQRDWDNRPTSSENVATVDTPSGVG